MTLHPQSRAVLAAMEAEDGPELPDGLDEVRAEMRQAALASRPHRARLRRSTSTPTECRAGCTGRALGAPVALYVHGGGWVLHDLETHDVFCRYLAHTTGWALLAVDYRRAPEHPFPAPAGRRADRGRLAARARREHRVDASFLPGIGDSSGANLIAGLCVRDPAALDFQVLMYPPVDRRAVLDEGSTAALDGPGMEWFWSAYAPGELGDHPEVSVAGAANLAEHPPAFVLTCEHDVLRDQAEAYAAQLADAGVEVTGHRALGMIHSFWRQPELFDASRSAVADGRGAARQPPGA